MPKTNLLFGLIFVTTVSALVSCKKTDVSATKDDSEGFGDASRASTLTLASPVSNQVFQRASDNFGRVFVNAAAIDKAYYMRLRVLNEKGEASTWQTATIKKTGTGISGEANLPAGGWYTLEVAVFDQNKVALAKGQVTKVGIGEVFVIVGQSNSTNCGDTPATVTSNKIVNTDGVIWQAGNDPQIGTHDASICNPRGGYGGSVWPATGDALAKKWDVPIAFASTGYSGTYVAEWLPKAAPISGEKQSLYEFTRARMQQLGARGFRAVLWHQGENDTLPPRGQEDTSLPGTTEDAYFRDLTATIAGFRADLSWPEMPWVVAQASWCPNGAYPAIHNGVWGASAAVVKAQARTWDNKTIFAGPNTDNLKEDTRSKIHNDCHFSGAGAKMAGDLWEQKISEFLTAVGAAKTGAAINGTSTGTTTPPTTPTTPTPSGSTGTTGTGSGTGTTECVCGITNYGDQDCYLYPVKEKYVFDKNTVLAKVLVPASIKFEQRFAACLFLCDVPDKGDNVLKSGDPATLPPDPVMQKAKAEHCSKVDYFLPNID